MVDFAACWDVARLTDFIFAADEVFAGDVAVVFGMTSWWLPTERAIGLYRSGTVKKLVFTGGFNPRIQQNEAEIMAKAAADRQVPSCDILVEADSTNTMQNVVNSYRCIGEAIGISKVQSILLVAIHFHMRRAKLAAERTFPARIRIGCASYPSALYTAQDWYTSTRGRQDVFSEALKIQKYFGCPVPGFSETVLDD